MTGWRCVDELITQTDALQMLILIARMSTQYEFEYLSFMHARCAMRGCFWSTVLICMSSDVPRGSYCIELYTV